MGSRRHSLRICAKKISAAFDTSPGEGGNADIKGVRARNAVKRFMRNGFLWLYYNFCGEYARQPVDLDDMCDGLLCLRAKNRIQEIYNEPE